MYFEYYATSDKSSPNLFLLLNDELPNNKELEDFSNNISNKLL